MSVIEKIEAFWVDATADDVARVMKGETVEARFRDSEVIYWQIGRLNGWANLGFLCELANFWRYCQVYREPSWYTNKPDPGPGYRLLGKSPSEDLRPGDEAWYKRKNKQWAKSDNANCGLSQADEIWYRRRIEPVEPKQKPTKPEEGSVCPTKGCFGALKLRPAKDCACHIRPPCSHCEYNPPCCEACGWTAGDAIEPVESKAKRYRDPTLGDLRNGPIDCEVRDCDDHDWKSGILVDIHDTVSSRFRVKTNVSGIPSHFNQCRIEPIEPVKKPIEPVEGAAHYPKIGDTIFLPEMGRLKVLARGVEIC